MARYPRLQHTVRQLLRRISSLSITSSFWLFDFALIFAGRTQGTRFWAERAQKLTDCLTKTRSPRLTGEVVAILLLPPFATTAILILRLWCGSLRSSWATRSNFWIHPSLLPPSLAPSSEEGHFFSPPFFFEFFLEYGSREEELKAKEDEDLAVLWMKCFFKLPRLLPSNQPRLTSFAVM